jgi:hypothetical protein
MASAFVEDLDLRRKISLVEKPVQRFPQWEAVFPRDLGD